MHRQHQKQRDEIEHAAEEQPGAALVGFDPVAGKHGNEGASQRAARSQLKQQIGNPKSGEIRVILSRCTVLRADDDFADAVR